MTNQKPHFSVKSSSFIREVYADKQKIGLVNFMHDITFGQGQISMLVSNQETFEFLYHNKIPMLCTNESGRTLPEGVYLNKTLQNLYQDCSTLMPLLPQRAAQFNQNYGFNSLHIVSKEKDCQHLYSLFFDLEENVFLQWTVNNGNFIQELIENYKLKANDIILEAKSTENRVLLPNSSDFFANVTHKKSSSICVFHKNFQTPVHLSPQQSVCFAYLMQGKSAKEVALLMKLSRRTVDHYFEKIRQVLGCKSNKELITSYYAQYL